MEEGLGRGDRALEVLGQSAVSVDPSEAALDHPSSGQDHEADSVGELFDDLDSDRGSVSDPVGAIGAVGEGAFDEGERSSRFPKQRDRAIAILDIGRAGLDHQGAAIAIDHGVTFVDFRFLAGVLATRAAGLGGTAMTSAAAVSRKRQGVR